MNGQVVALKVLIVTLVTMALTATEPVMDRKRYHFMRFYLSLNGYLIIRIRSMFRQ